MFSGEASRLDQLGISELVHATLVLVIRHLFVAFGHTGYKLLQYYYLSVTRLASDLTISANSIPRPFTKPFGEPLYRKE
jgi:hypothetical protein